MNERVPEKVQVFVSSTIKECAVERGVAKRAIESLNHEAILFEHIGARSATAREVYTSKLDVSHIFVGITKGSRSSTHEAPRSSKGTGQVRVVYGAQRTI